MARKIIQVNRPGQTSVIMRRNPKTDTAKISILFSHDETEVKMSESVAQKLVDDMTKLLSSLTFQSEREVELDGEFIDNLINGI